MIYSVKYFFKQLFNLYNNQGCVYIIETLLPATILAVCITFGNGISNITLRGMPGIARAMILNQICGHVYL